MTHAGRANDTRKRAIRSRRCPASRQQALCIRRRQRVTVEQPEEVLHGLWQWVLSPQCRMAGVQVFQQPADADQPVDARGAVQPAKGQRRCAMHASRAHGADVPPERISTYPAGKGCILRDDDLWIPLQQLFHRHAGQ